MSLKRFGLVFLAGILAFGIAGCGDAVARHEEDGLIGDYRNRNEEEVKKIQLILMYSGFDLGYVDGGIGPDTRSAIVKFQKSHDLKASGHIDKRTWKEIYRIEEASGPFHAGRIQRALVRAGFYSGHVDGVIGAKTRRALRDYQKSRGLTKTGTINPETWTELKNIFR
ncbi:peptidoglycan-binding protein [Elusimicrobiota bacterium]